MARWWTQGAYAASGDLMHAFYERVPLRWRITLLAVIGVVNSQIVNVIARGRLGLS